MHCFNILVLNADYYALIRDSTLSFPKYLRNSQIKDRKKILSQKETFKFVSRKRKDCLHNAVITGFSTGYL